MEYTNSQIRDLIREHIHNERDRKILYRRLVDGVCFEPLAEEFDMSVRQILFSSSCAKSIVILPV